MGVIRDLSDGWTEADSSIGQAPTNSDAFERFVLGLLIGGDFSCIEATPRRHDFGGGKIEGEKDPDFRLRDRRSGTTFWVECKYRALLTHNRVVWTSPQQLERFKRFQVGVRPEKVYIVIGLGGSFRKPEYMWCIPLDEAERPGIHIDKLARFEHFKERPFRLIGGQLR